MTAQPSPIDPQETASAQAITASDISNIPYPTTRDYRNVLPFVPGVVGRRQIHIAGASTQEIQDYLDGFEVSQPATGALALRVNPDSLRKIDLRSSRYSAQFGKGSGGLVDLQVQDGDNRFRMNATDFSPRSRRERLPAEQLDAAGYFSGPMVRDKIWLIFPMKRDRLQHHQGTAGRRGYQPGLEDGRPCARAHEPDPGKCADGERPAEHAGLAKCGHLGL